MHVRDLRWVQCNTWRHLILDFGGGLFFFSGSPPEAMMENTEMREGPSPSISDIPAFARGCVSSPASAKATAGRLDIRQSTLILGSSLL